MPTRRDPQLYIDDILEAIANIEADTEGLDFERFAVDRRVRQLVARDVEIPSGHDPGLRVKAISAFGYRHSPQQRWDHATYARRAASVPFG
jgi:hypothetical protein